MAYSEYLDINDDNLLPELSFIVHNINMLEHEIKFMLDNCQFSLLPVEFFNAVYDVKKSIEKVREVYTNSLRFSKPYY